MREEGKYCAGKQREGWRHALSNIRRSVKMKIVLKDTKKDNIVGMRERVKTVSQSKDLIR